MEINKDFLDQYQDLIYRVIRTSGITKQDTIEDLYSNIIIRVLEHNNYDKNKAGISTWLTFVSRSVVGNYLKHMRASQDALDQANVSLHVLTGRPDTRDDGGTTSLIKDEIESSSLSDTYKEVLLHRFYYGYGNRETAKLTGLSYDNVRKMVVRGTKRLGDKYVE